jgi:putative tricarboxylic transport membrane protein
LDGTARAVGQVLRSEGLIERVSYENMTGGGGGRAMSHFIETAARQHDSLIVNSTPLLIRSLQGLFPHGHHDLTPIAALIGDYGAFIVRADSALNGWPDVATRLREDPRSLVVGGGSVRGSLDHIVLAMALGEAGIDPRRVRYLPYDGGGKAMLALLGAEVDVLSSGFGESLPFLIAGDVRVLAVTAPERLATYPGIPTLVEAGVEVILTNWRGVFGPPGLSSQETAAQIAMMGSMVRTEAWRETLARYGWVDLYKPGLEFTNYLDAQEAQLRETLSALGFLR